MENEIRVNGRSLEEELKRIEDFFDNLSDEEFVEMIERNGANEIKESWESSFVLAAQPFMCFKSHLKKNMYRSNQIKIFDLDMNREEVA